MAENAVHAVLDALRIELCMWRGCAKGPACQHFDCFPQIVRGLRRLCAKTRSACEALKSHEQELTKQHTAVIELQGVKACSYSHAALMITEGFIQTCLKATIDMRPSRTSKFEWLYGPSERELDDSETDPQRWLDAAVEVAEGSVDIDCGEIRQWVRREWLLLGEEAYSRERPPREWCIVFSCSLGTFKKRRDDGTYRSIEVTSRRVRIHLSDVPKDYDDEREYTE